MRFDCVSVNQLHKGLKKMDVSKRAKVLIQAMPYIKKYSGETIVVKYGGNAMINEELKAAVMSDLVLMQLVGVNVVLVHGGGPEINAMLKSVGKESKFINGMSDRQRNYRHCSDGACRQGQQEPCSAPRQSRR